MTTHRCWVHFEGWPLPLFDSQHGADFRRHGLVQLRIHGLTDDGRGWICSLYNWTELMFTYFYPGLGLQFEVSRAKVFAGSPVRRPKMEQQRLG